MTSVRFKYKAIRLFFGAETVILLLLLLPSFSFAQDKFYFQTPVEGLYKIANPFVQEDIDQVYCRNQEVIYQPHFDRQNNQFVVYGHRGTTYQLCKDTSLAKQVFFPLKKVEYINAESAYKTTLPNTTNEKQSFHKIIEWDDIYTEKLYVGRSRIGQSDTELLLYLYNFGKQKSSIEITINDSIKEVSLPPKSESQVLLPCKDDNGYVELSIYSPFSNVGLIQYEYSIVDKKISYQTPFSSYTYSKPQVFSAAYLKSVSKDRIYDLESRFSHYAMVEGVLSEIGYTDTLTSFSNLFIQDRNQMLELPIHPCGSLLEEAPSYLIIYNEVFESSIDPLIELVERTTSNQVVKAIDVQAIYDHYAFSSSSNTAIKEYIHSVDPMYVLLVGDASSARHSGEDLLPAFYNTSQLQSFRYATDYPYSYHLDAGQPTVAVGRIPATNDDELMRYVEKVKRYLSVDKAKDHQILIIEDIDTFVRDSSLANFEIHHEEFPYSKATIRERIFGNEGVNLIDEQQPNIVCHIGHASFTGWSKKEKITISDFKRLNQGTYFKLIDISCLAGAFDYQYKSFSEELLLDLTEQGPVVVLGATGYTRIKSYNAFANSLLSIYTDIDLGQSINKIKRLLFHRDEIDIDDLHAYNILGMPNL
ncbi:MAG: C25 family cysteine peptidase [Bacteroidota bacterium]